jgi:RHS repeat-associated protein
VLHRKNPQPFTGAVFVICSQLLATPQENPCRYGAFASGQTYQYFDSESNLHQNYFRSYDPKQGRYTQSDPIGLKGGANRFGYVGSNALNSSDPKGLQVLIPRPYGIPFPIAPMPGVNNTTQPPGWDPADGPAPGSGTIIWPPGFSSDPVPPSACYVEVPVPQGPPPPKNDCDSQIRSCMAFARASGSWLMISACLVQYAICRKLGQ